MSRHLSPPASRSPLWKPINEASREKVFKLQVCGHCEKVQYPPREFCDHCLSDRLNWRTVNNRGVVMSWTKLSASNNEFFKRHLPWHVGYIKLDVGPALFAHLTAASAKTGTAVQILNRIDPSGQGVFFALAVGDESIEAFKAIIEE